MATTDAPAQIKTRCPNLALFWGRAAFLTRFRRVLIGPLSVSGFPDTFATGNFIGRLSGSLRETIVFV